MGPLAKLFAACLNGALEREAQSKGWRGPTQAGFWCHHRLEDLILPVDSLISHAQQLKIPLALYFVDMEKAFDTVPHQRLVCVLIDHYGVNPSMVETIRHMCTST